MKYMSISNQVKYLELTKDCRAELKEVYYEHTRSYSILVPLNFRIDVKYKKRTGVLELITHNGEYNVECIFDILKDYHSMDEYQFILTYGKDPFGLNYFDRYIVMVLNHPKLTI